MRFPLSSDNQLSRSTCCLRLLRANAPSRCSHPCGPSIPAPGGSAAHAQAVEPASQTPAVPAPPRRRKSAGCARRAASLHACRRTPLMIRVNCADAAAVAGTCGAALHHWQLRLSSGPSPPSGIESTALTLRRFNCHCHVSSLQIACSLLSSTSPTLHYSVFNRLQQLARASQRPALTVQLNTTLQCHFAS